MTYTPEQLSEKDRWILEKIYGWKRGKPFGNGNGEWIYKGNVICTWQTAPSVTTGAAASDALDDKILEKLGEDGYQIWHDGKNFIMCRRNGLEPHAKHPDKKICRALFCEKLWAEK